MNRGENNEISSAYTYNSIGKIQFICIVSMIYIDNDVPFITMDVIDKI